jgi:hypothetical protein
MLVRDTQVVLSKAEKFHWDNYVMVKRWGKWPAEWRGCGWRHEHIVGINYLEDLFIKAQLAEQQQQQGDSSSKATSSISGGGAITKTRTITKQPQQKGSKPRIDF